ncbi:unnamed protein product [Lepeophtheirus salmonis]|uniref:(salmon louse) hypothetical protein n=1 Tax=Lepeophtheirus salmonis TaxID=72036 RepID=A0A817FDY8_LEPSM|nr:unnamed protein product [Lepeophtheirus salmonis]
MMEDLRCHQFRKTAATSKTTIKPQSLAPTKNAAMSLFANPSPAYHDRFMTAPDNILHLIGCNCNVSKISLCSTNVCSCSVSAFGNCIGVECENCDHEEVSSDKDSVGSDEEADRNIFDIFDV